MSYPNIIQQINSKLPLSGGTMSGGIISSSDVAYQTNNSSHCDYGYNYADRTGALLAVRSSSYTNNPGGFELVARNETEHIALTGKTDGTLNWGGKSVVSLVKYYRSGANWYRKYSDGFIEQGGNFSNSARGTTVTFPLAFTSTNYQALACINHADNGWTATTTACVRARTTSNMVVQIYHNSSNTTGLNSWYACGY